MNAFATMNATLHADPNMAVAAQYRRPSYTWQSIRVIMSQPVDPVAGDTIAGSRQADILTADVRDEPGRGDELRIGDTTYKVESAEGDALGLSWRVTLSSPAED